MAKLKLTWKASMGAALSVGLLVNGELLMTSNQKEAAAIAAAKGKKNYAPFVIKKTRSLIGDFVEFETKPANIIQVAVKTRKNGEYKPVKKSFAKFEAKKEDATVKVEVKKRGFLFSLIFGRYSVKAK